LQMKSGNKRPITPHPAKLRPGGLAA
jgi:hypothetical protein